MNTAALHAARPANYSPPAGSKPALLRPPTQPCPADSSLPPLLVRQVDTHISRSRQILSTMSKRILQNKLIMWGIILVSACWGNYSYSMMRS